MGAVGGPSWWIIAVDHSKDTTRATSKSTHPRMVEGENPETGVKSQRINDSTMMTTRSAQTDEEGTTLSPPFSHKA
jgi:hypothetical protein